MGCVLSSDLLNLYVGVIIREMDMMDGFSVAGRNWNNVRYANDTVMITNSAEKLQELFSAMDETNEKKILKINRAKIECMMLSKRNVLIDCHVEIHQEPTKKFEEFQYLGSVLALDARCATK